MVIKLHEKLATELKVDQDTINNWIKKYKEQGESGLKRTNANPTKKRNKDSREIKELKAQIKAKDMENRNPKKVPGLSQRER